MPSEADRPAAAASPGAPRSPRPGRQPRPARKADPNQPPFSGYLERDSLRLSRQKGRRRTLIISVAIHVVVFGGLLLYSLFQVEELWGPSVEVKVFSPGKLPPGVATPKPAAP